jgi:2-dehydropantoate 2-reductase
MRIAVFGAGGVGGFFGARLLRSGQEVLFIARGSHLEAIRANGLRLEGPDGHVLVNPTTATNRSDEVGPVDAVLVAVKAWQVEEAAKAMKPLIGETTIVIPFQNGVEAPGQLARVLGREHVIAGLCILISYIKRPGVIQHVGGAPYVALGELDNKKTERVLALRRLIEEAGGVRGSRRYSGRDVE